MRRQRDLEAGSPCGVLCLRTVSVVFLMFYRQWFCRVYVVFF